MRNFLVSFCFALLLSCGTPKPPCSASNCFGCCDAKGECQSSTTLTCGLTGAVCQSCQFGQTCTFGSCRVPVNNSGGGTASAGGNGFGGGEVTGGGTTASGGGEVAGGGTTASGGGTTASGGGTTSSGGGTTASGGGTTASGGGTTASGGGTTASGGGTTASGGGTTASGGGTTASGGGATGGGTTASGGGATASGGGATGGGTTGGGNACGVPMPGNPTIIRTCSPATVNECDGPTDSALAAAQVPLNRRNSTSGNGFDDDCDGKVDEGCGCPGNGLTKDCFLVPATQVDAANGIPVGWCASNAKGSLDCAGSTWSGVCRGAQAPLISDTCTAGDFNCDGLQANNALQGCQCSNSVSCPTAAITLAPYPNPVALPLVDGSLWIDDVNSRSLATNWKWTVLGGDCDNVLPQPTFALYNNQNSSIGIARRGTRTPVGLQNGKYVFTAGSPLISIQDAAYGNGISGGQVYPAFALSGDYLLQGEFTLNGVTQVCTQKVQVRAPGIRAELCWDTVGAIDLDLHFARLQGNTCASNGWNATCQTTTPVSTQDCDYTPTSGCRAASANPPNWGYTNSPDSACIGWGSARQLSSTQRCTNPRLDRDNITCTRSTTDPVAATFCGPENTNLDNPKNADTFVVGVNHYSGSGSHRPHVNLYCNGQRVLSAGYNPAGQINFPVLNTAGADTTGDFWTVATIKANVNANNILTSCDVAAIPSRISDSVRDGPANPTGAGGFCVDHNYASKKFVDTGTSQGLTAGSIPNSPLNWCKH
jgi:hypothetical protein